MDLYEDLHRKTRSATRNDKNTKINEKKLHFTKVRFRDQHISISKFYFFNLHL